MSVKSINRKGLVVLALALLNLLTLTGCTPTPTVPADFSISLETWSGGDGPFLIEQLDIHADGHVEYEAGYCPQYIREFYNAYGPLERGNCTGTIDPDELQEIVTFSKHNSYIFLAGEYLFHNASDLPITVVRCTMRGHDRYILHDYWDPRGLKNAPAAIYDLENLIRELVSSTEWESLP